MRRELEEPLASSCVDECVDGYASGSVTWWAATSRSNIRQLRLEALTSGRFGLQDGPVERLTMLRCNYLEEAQADSQICEVPVLLFKLQARERERVRTRGREDRDRQKRKIQRKMVLLSKDTKQWPHFPTHQLLIKHHRVSNLLHRTTASASTLTHTHTTR